MDDEAVLRLAAACALMVARGRVLYFPEGDIWCWSVDALVTCILDSVNNKGAHTLMLVNRLLCNQSHPRFIQFLRFAIAIEVILQCRSELSERRTVASLHMSHRRTEDEHTSFHRVGCECADSQSPSCPCETTNSLLSLMEDLHIIPPDNYSCALVDVPVLLEVECHPSEDQLLSTKLGGSWLESSAKFSVAIPPCSYNAYFFSKRKQRKKRVGRAALFFSLSSGEQGHNFVSALQNLGVSVVLCQQQISQEIHELLLFHDIAYVERLGKQKCSEFAKTIGDPQFEGVREFCCFANYGGGSLSRINLSIERDCCDTLLCLRPIAKKRSALHLWFSQNPLRSHKHLLLPKEPQAAVFESDLLEPSTKQMLATLTCYLTCVHQESILNLDGPSSLRQPRLLTPGLLPDDLEGLSTIVRFWSCTAMSQSPNEWGDMVLPGVYMIQRKVRKDATFAKEDGTIDYEYIFQQIEEIGGRIMKLTESNEYITEYIATRQKERTDDCGIFTCSASNEDNDDEMLRETLVENDSVIRRLTKELQSLMATVGNQKCGCSVAHAPTPSTETQLQPNPDRILL